MKLQGNALLKVGVPVLVVGMILIVIKSCSSGGEEAGQNQQQAAQDDTRTLSQDEMDALGISGDSSQDTVATLVGKMNAWERQRQRDQERMESLVEENNRLAERASNVNRSVNEAIQQERERQQRAREQSEQSLLSRFENRLDRLVPADKDSSGNDGQSGNDDMPIGLGLEGGGGPSGSYSGGGNLAWVEPMDRRQEEGRSSRSSRDDGPAFPTSFKAAADTAGDLASRASSAAESRVTGEPDASTVEPVYTIPENSTLMGSLAMTALLGRVPVDGTVSDPYPFKVMIGKDNLTANGIELPEVRAAVASGTATGDWTLSCVRGNITSLTFVFEDGTIRTVPSPDDVNQNGGDSNGGSNQNQSIGGGNAIGWISDQAGLPCISGMRRSNAQQYLGTQGLLTAAGASAATMLSDDDSTSITSFGSDGSISQAMSGNQAVGQILSQGVNDMSEWVNKLYGEAFAAVYVPPGQNVAIHINKQLPIDYETEGRKVRYDTSTATTVGLD